MAKVYFCGQSNWQMNLLAFFESLGIGRESLTDLDENGLIRIEKQVHLQRKLNPDIDMNLANAMISALRQDGPAFRFVLENRRLFNFFTGKLYPQRDFNPQDVEEQVVQDFIGKYLQDDLLLAIDRMLIANQYESLDDILEEKAYFPEEVQFTITKKLLTKIDFGIGRMIAKQYEAIQFLKFRTFYNCLSHLTSVDTDKKINTLLDVTADQYNAKKNASFASGVMIAMSNYRTDDEELSRVLVSNHAIMTSSNGKSGTGFNMNWRIVFFVVFFLIKIMVIGSKCSNDDNVTEINSNLNQALVEQVATLKEKMEAKNERFGNYLINFDSAGVKQAQPIDTLKSGQHPFKTGVFLIADSGNTQQAIFKNETSYDVILLQYMNSIMGKSYFIKSGETTSIIASTDQNKLEYRIYCGTKPAVFYTDSELMQSGKDSLSEIRFRHLAPKAQVVFEKKVAIAKDISLQHSANRLMLVGDGVTCSSCFPSVSDSSKRINRLN